MSVKDFFVRPSAIQPEQKASFVLCNSFVHQKKYFYTTARQHLKNLSGTAFSTANRIQEVEISLCNQL